MKRTINILIVVGLLTGVASFVADRFSSTKPDIKKIESRIQELIGEIDIETNQIISNPDQDNWSQYKHTYFLIDSSGIVRWSNTEVNPDISVQTDKYLLVQRSYGHFVYKTIEFSDNKWLLIVIPISRNYSISNQYLSSQNNKNIFGSLSVSIASLESSGDVIAIAGEPVFKITFNDYKNTFYASSIFWLLSVSVLAFGTVIFLKSKRLLNDGRTGQSLFLLIVLLPGIRYLLLFIDYPNKWLTTDLFNPQVFASSSLNASLGDLIINAIIVLVIVLRLSQLFKDRLSQYSSGKPSAMIYSLLAIIFGYFSFLYPFLFIETISHNSAIILDITRSLSFNVLQIFAWASIGIGFCTAVVVIQLVFHVLQYLNISQSRFLFYNALGLLSFLTYAILIERDYLLIAILAFVFLSLLYNLHVATSGKSFQFSSVVYVFVLIATLSIEYSLSIRRFTIEKDIDSSFKLADRLIAGRDLLGEFLLNEASKKIEIDALLQTSFATPLFNKSTILQRVKQQYLGSYFNRYDLSLVYYNSIGEPIDVNEPFNIKTRQDLLKGSVKTDYKNIFLINATGKALSRQYVVIIPLKKDNQNYAYAELRCTLKRIIPDNVYPQLLVDNRFMAYTESGNRSYAFINRGEILNASGDYNYAVDFNKGLIELPELFNEGVINGGAIHVAAENDSSQIVIVTTTDYSVFSVLINFAYFFFVSLITAGSILLIYVILFTKGKIHLNYSSRIQLYLYLAFSIPLIVTTITSLYRVTRSAEHDLNNSYQTTVKRLTELFSGPLESYYLGQTSRIDLENYVLEQAGLFRVDINVFNSIGRSIGSSQPAIYTNNLESSLISRRVIERVKDGENNIILSENIGQLKFNNCYQAIRSGDGSQVLGYMSVPFLDSVRSLEMIQINIFSNFLAIFTLIFVVFSVISFYVVNKLTSPLQYITKALSETTLSEDNKPLTWRSEDEIGLMVKAYNKMVYNLEKSKIELSRAQKEAAWREIAKQVAHEIKNPLTPIKLTLQQVERLSLNKELNAEQLDRAIKVLLEQVEILNEIATSFSTFAKMPAPQLQKLELTLLIERCVQLHAHTSNGNVNYHKPEGELFIMGDDQLFSRIISNIILNALQAGTNVTVTITIELVGNDAIISIKDNGEGIDTELAEQIFLPHFTTKKTGSGLGLAIAKQGIEQSGGEIWFESEIGKGTTFYIRLPRLNN